MKRLLSLLFCVLVVTSLFAGCTQDEPVAGSDDPVVTADEPTCGGTLNLAMWSSPAGVFNPVLSSDTYDANLNGLVYDSLWTYDANMDFEPRLAESWEVSPDNLTITFHIREDVKFHDGEPLTAEDVYFTYMTICHPDYSGPRSYTAELFKGYDEYHGKLDADASANDPDDPAYDPDNPVYEIEPFTADHVEGIKLIDPYTISFTAKEIYASFMSEIAYGILPEHILKDVPVAELPNHEFNSHPIGAGPYKFSEYNTDLYATFEAFDDYYLGRPYIDQVIYHIKNQEVALMELESGDLDIVDIFAQDFDMVSGWDHVQVRESMDLGYQYMAINHRREIFQDKRVRQAFMYAINRQGIVDNILLGHGGIMNAPIPPISWAYSTDVSQYPYDPDRALELLEEAGWSMGDDGVLEKDGNKFSVSLMYPTGNQVREQSAPLIQENLKAVGIEVDLQLMDFASMRQKAITDHDFDLCLIAWGITPDPDASFAFHSSQVNNWNYVGFVNDENDRLLDEGLATLDMNERKAVYQQWCKIVNEELPYAFLYCQNNIFGINNRIKGANVDWRWQVGGINDIEKLWISDGN